MAEAGAARFLAGRPPRARPVTVPRRAGRGSVVRGRPKAVAQRPWPLTAEGPARTMRGPRFRRRPCRERGTAAAGGRLHGGSPFRDGPVIRGWSAQAYLGARRPVRHRRHDGDGVPPGMGCGCSILDGCPGQMARQAAGLREPAAGHQLNGRNPRTFRTPGKGFMVRWLAARPHRPGRAACGSSGGPACGRRTAARAGHRSGGV